MTLRTATKRSDGASKKRPTCRQLVITIIRKYNPTGGLCQTHEVFGGVSTMPDLRQCLAALPYDDLRGVAIRLGVRRRTEQRKAAWIESVAQAWQSLEQRAALLASLSPAACAAATRLAHSGELPAALFLAEYGAVRRPRPGQHWTPPPWAAPQTISEELYYCGLLAAIPPAPLAAAARVALPADLQPLFLAQPDLAQSNPSGLGDLTGFPEGLVHDVAQALCFLAEQPDLTLLHDRWLAPAALAHLNGRLLRPERWPLPRAHARARRLRFLFFLATAADLQAGGRLTPLGWTWLVEPPAARLTRLWNAWRTAPLALRHAYRQATAALPAPWPDLALKYLATLPPAFTAAQLTQAVLGHETAYTAYFAAHLPDISALDAAAASLLETLVEDWGALASAAPADPAPAFRLTALGRWLLDPPPGDLPTPAFAADSAEAARLNVQEAAGWQLTVSPLAPPIHLARLAAYARHVDLTPALAVPQAASLRHVYRLDEDTVAAAAAAGHGLPALLAAFTGLGVQLSPSQLAALQAWHARGHELELTLLPLLHATRPELLSQLLGQAAVRAGLGDLLSPTTAVITIPPAELADRLRAAGFFPQGTGVRDQEPAARSQASAGDDPAAIGDQRSAGDTANLQSAFCILQSRPALWLAGQLYAALGEHTHLPLPPPFADLTALLAELPPLQQAVVQAQWETLRAAFLAVLDGQTYAPPPQPSDPALWRPRIDAAIAAGHSLTMRYFTAGRNVLTERTVTPYWIEEHRGIPYLRADCHLAGRVRLFRLDRIQELQETSRQGNR